MKAPRLAVLFFAVTPFAALACLGDDDVVLDGDGNDRDGSVTSSGAPSSSSSSSGASGSSSGGTSSSGDGGGSSGDGGGCDRTPRPDDAPHFVAASRPYADQEATPSGTLSLFSLATDGTLTPLPSIEMAGVQSYGSIAFSPDGRTGALAYDSVKDDDDLGAIGVFRLDADGNATVVHTVYKDQFTAAESVQFSPDGEWLYILDGNTTDNGGGVYAAKVGCDGTLGATTKVVGARGVTAPFWLHQDPSRALVAGDQLPGAPNVADSLHLLSFSGAQATRLGSADVTGTPTSIRYVAVSTDDKVALLTAWNEFLGGPRLIAARLDGETPSLIRAWDADSGLLGSAEVALASPYGNAFFVTSSMSDRAYRLAYAADGIDAGDADASSVLGPLTELTASSVPPLVHGNPQLSATGAVIQRGALKGRIVIGEVAALRQFQFNPDGTITDVARLETGSEDDITSSLGSIGVTP